MTDRDHQIARLVADFGHLRSGDVRLIVFPEHKSNTSSDRALQRLVKRKYIQPVELRLIGGRHGGSGQYTYELTPLGKRLFSPDTYKKPKMSDVWHTFAITETYIAIKALEKTGRYEVVSYATEPSNWHMLAGVKLRSDLYVELGDKTRGKLLSWWLEVDMDNEGAVAITDKLNRYYHAWKHVKDEDFPLPTMPRVVFLVPHEKRAIKIRALIREQPAEAHHLFDVKLRAEFPAAIL